ncbi:PREDICTED: uncharacterized protein LOC109206936, partial [Nicotiana attenuata]|uniref:uncharacterized protein LOC109206936 n=1 Tax=Nicotiana attenuata TaxID=49451 RepID=UPI00090523E4
MVDFDVIMESEPPALQSVPVVREFPEVFPDHPPGLPPERIIDFGIDLMPAAFMDLMNRVSKPFLDTFIIVFVDDILVYSKSKDEHAEHLRIALQTLKENSVEFLGHVVSSEGTKVDPHKTEAVKNWPRPTTPTKIRSFLGLAIEEFSRVKEEIDHCTYVNLADRLDETEEGGITAYALAQSSLVAHVKAMQDEDPPTDKVRAFSTSKDERFRREVFQKRLGTKINLSIAFHPQTDDQAKRTILTLEDMLRACVIDFGGNWNDHFPLIEFAYNNSYQASIDMAPYEVLYGRRCRSLVGWFELAEVSLIGPELVCEALEKVQLIRERLKAAQSRQKSYYDKWHRDLELMLGDK